jgi:hypothetical protein
MTWTLTTREPASGVRISLNVYVRVAGYTSLRTQSMRVLREATSVTDSKVDSLAYRVSPSGTIACSGSH